MANTDHVVKVARERVAELRSPLRKTLAALAEVERVGALGFRNVFGRYRLHSDEDTEGVAAFISDAQEEYAGRDIEVVVIIADQDDDTNRNGHSRKAEEVPHRGEASQLRR